MRGIRFYEERYGKGGRYESSRGTVIAVAYENSWFSAQGDICYDAIGGVYERPNSPVASVGTSREYLERDCKRISEMEARAIHPALFRYLDQEA